LIVNIETGAVAIRWTVTGTHRTPFLGIAAIGRRIAFAGIEPLRIRDGLIVERSGEWAAYSLLRQLGALPG